MEIVPGVHRIEGVNGSNSVLLVDEQMALVETGISGNGDAVVSYIKKLGRSPRDLRWIVNTHFHHDHAGSAVEIHELTGAKIVAHRDETETTSNGKILLRKGDEGEPPPFWYRWMLGRWRAPTLQQREYPDTEVHQIVEDDEVVPVLGGLRVMHTPGHTPGSVCLELRNPKVLFLGDSVINNITRLSRPVMWDRNKRRKLDASLRRLRELEAQAACFGHGPPLAEEVMIRIRNLTDKPYDLPTWRIVLKNWGTLKRFYLSTRRPGHWGQPERPQR